MKKLIENIVDHKWSDDWLSYKFTVSSNPNNNPIIENSTPTV